MKYDKYEFQNYVVELLKEQIIVSRYEDPDDIGMHAMELFDNLECIELVNYLGMFLTRK